MGAYVATSLIDSETCEISTYQEYGVGKRCFIMSASRPASPDWALRGNRHRKISENF